MNQNFSDLQKKILKLKKEKKALILAHNYQTLDIQEIADFVGDSLQLARKSAESNGYEMIIFAGVKFMAEMAAVLSPDVPVYIPDPRALCPLAAYLDAEKVRAKKREYPGVPVVVYVNTTAEAKSEADYICTSGSAVEVVESIGENTVLFGPDANLADYVRNHTDVEIIDLDEEGHCYVHDKFELSMLEDLKKKYPDSLAIAHPECPIEVQRASDMIGSTGMMANTVASTDAKIILIATEIGMIQQLQKAHPDKTVIPFFDGAVCRQMKKHTLEKILNVLENLPEENVVTVPEKYVPHIRQILEKMNKVRGQGPATAVTVETT
ncbi:quinolinate synthase NadA [Candidatus Thorarchaeota archaeon]|nr:MAG: quinolinate synthase NadA [Candidatus Thorarchaeota archaeon]